ncbi:uncharacterized protein LOC141610872 isoform X2 [Silene latifolia]|uniref:uncharacterized protein LOC141610872 isoform X2 n=1 Tax=Silene latifolia TaxID=37657 RepID=UPI003D7830AC
MHQFTRWNDKSAFTRRHNNHHTTTVYLLRPPHSHSSSQPWITARETNPDYTFTFRHPLTSKPHSFTTPLDFDFFKLYPSDLAVSYCFGDSYPVDKLLKFSDGSLLALYGGGRIQACPRYAPEEDNVAGGTSPWIELSPSFNIDDIIVFQDKVYAVDRRGWFVLIHSYKTVRKFKIRRNIMTSVTPGADGFGWRKRLVIDGENLYMVVRDEEKSFRVYSLKKRGKTPGKCFVWDRVDQFKGKKVLFIAKDHYFFRKASRKFPGREYRNCIVFSEAAFPQYGKGRWEYTQSDRQLSEDDIAVYRLKYGDRIFVREGENSVFPKINWSPPDWIFNASSIPAAEFQEHMVSDSSSQSEREPDEDDGLDSDNGDKNDREVQSDLRDTKSKDDDEQEEMETEEMETDFGCLDQDQDGVVSHSDSQNKEDEMMHFKEANIEVGASLQEDVCHVSPTLSRPESGTTVTQTHSLSPTERTPLSLNGGSNGTEEGNDFHISTSKPFTRITDESAFTCRHHCLHYTQVHVLHPPRSLFSDHCPWITARETTANNTVIFRHPLTSKPYSLNLPENFNIFKLHPSTISISYHLGESYPVDNLLVFPASSNFLEHYDPNSCAFLALYGGGQLRGCPCYGQEERWSGSDYSPWVKLSPFSDLDDITVFQDKIYGVTSHSWVVMIYYYKTTRIFRVGRTIMSGPLSYGIGWFGWRKRFVVCGENLYLVVRTAEKSFRVYMLKKQGMSPGSGFYWDRVDEFKGNKALFMARDYYFFIKASRMFPGKEYKNCIVFSEAAFPKYGNGCWEFTKSGDRQFSEDDIAVFRLDDQTFAREGENSVFPKIDWSPPDWILNVSSFPADEFQEHTLSESSSNSEREPGEDHGLDSDSVDKNDGEVQSDLRDTKSKDADEQEEMETDFGSLDQDQDGVVSRSDSLNKEDGNMQFDSNSQEKEDVVMHVNANTEGGASLQEDVCHVSPTLYRPESGTTVTQTPFSATEKEIPRTSLSLNDGNNGTEEGTSTKNIIDLVHRASTSSTRVRQRSDFATAVFEGFDIRPDLVPTLQKIWQKHGNILENSAVRSDDIIARGLESLATIVRILGDNSALSLNDRLKNYIKASHWWNP